MPVSLPLPPPAAAQDDPAAEINRLAEELHIQNLRTHNVTRWVGGDLGSLDGTEVGIPAGTVLDDWTFVDLYDESVEVNVDDLDRPVVMNIWASWCGPCRFEFPFLTEYALHHETSYDLWFLNSGDTVSAAKRFLRDQAEGITNYFDTGDRFNDSIRMRVFPTTVLVDTDGTLLVAHSGVVTRTVMEFFEAVAANPDLGSVDASTIDIPDLGAIIGPVDSADTEPIVYGQQVVGELDDETWKRGYRFEGNAGDEVVITMTAADEGLDAYVVLIGPDGERLAENDDSSVGTTDSSIDMTLPETGTYIIVATRFLEADGFGSGGYSLQVATTDQQDPGQVGNANVLEIGIPVSGRLTFELKQQNYLLEATEGQVLRFTLTHDIPEERLNLQVRLGAGERLVPYTGTQNGELEVEAEVFETGSFSVYVSRPQNSRVGPITYTLLVTEVGEAGPPETDPTEQALSYGDTATGAIANDAVTQTFTFEGTAGDIVTIAVEATSGDLDTTLALIAPDGTT
ncbi:MAG: redoxin family protein, partial [Chloroflexi bacterium]|nr:redoxin family protein [Chloroflexota bacterium]